MMSFSRPLPVYGQQLKNISNSKELPAVEQYRHRTVVNQLDVHRLAKAARRYPRD
jgi:hypothetical protein